MLILLSPAKSLDMQARLATDLRSTPRLLDETHTLVAQLKELSASELKKLMKLSDKLAELNRARYQAFSAQPLQETTAQAAAAFDGDVYAGLNARCLSAHDIAHAQTHLRMLSGLYGVLRPCDLLQPYRLEMGTRLSNARGEDLYDFWGERITQILAEDAREAKAGAIVNLASNEYFKAVRPQMLAMPIISPVFKERKDGQSKIISFYAKKARGLMARWIITHRITTPDALKDFAEDGYRFAQDEAVHGEFLFIRG